MFKQAHWLFIAATLTSLFCPPASWAVPKFPRVDEASLSLGPGFSFEESRAFKRAESASPGSGESEKARVDYLLERVSSSPYNFFRNGSRYRGKRAEAHLKWKYLRNLKRVKTAEDFIDQVASFSKMSGEKYLLELPDKKRIPLRPVLLNELKLFDEVVASERETEGRTPPISST